MRGFQRHEQAVVVQPVALIRGPGVECGLRIGIGLLAEARKRSAQLCQAPRHHACEIHLRCVESVSRQGGRRQPAGGDQRLQRHHQRTARKRRHALVRRIAGANRIGRQQLPDALARLRQPVDKAEGIGAKIADAMRAGQGSDVQQNASAAGME